MTTYNWMALADKKTISFAPVSDVFRFDDPSISAASVTVTLVNATSVTFAYGGKTVTLLVDVRSLTTSNLTFADSSLLIFGDNSLGGLNDDGDNTISGSGRADQIFGLGGVDSIQGGSRASVLNGGDGDDYIIGGS